jgi:transposase
MDSHDARDLIILALDRAGSTADAIAKDANVSARTVRRRILSIRTDDIAHDPGAAAWWHANHPQRSKGTAQ